MQKSTKAGICLTGLLMIPVTACGDMQQKAPPVKALAPASSAQPSELLKTLEQAGRVETTNSIAGSVCD